MDIKKVVTIEEKCGARYLFKDDKYIDSNNASKSQKNPRKYMGKKPAEVYRTDFITAMKLPDNQQLQPNEYLVLNDPWRQEWEKGVQVPVNPDKTPKPVVRNFDSPYEAATSFSLPTEHIKFNEEAYLASFDRSTTSCDYDLDDVDIQWLQNIKSLQTFKKASSINELTMERAITWFERECFEKMAHAVATKEGLSIEYDETTTCNVCLSPDAEDGNEIIFCDACNMCAHQHCYGVLEIPEGNWLCNPCSRGILSPPCCLCPNKGGAMKRMKDSFEWIHVICAWWVPEVKIEDVTYIERITKDKIPNTRWNLTCSICWEKTGACIQCSVKRCVRAYHITCAVKEGLEMKTVVVPENDDVQHISYCSKHCDPVPPERNPHVSCSGEDLENNRLKELRKLESVFYKLVSVRKASRELKLSKEVARSLLSYWTMKRRANDNTALIQLTLEQQEKLSGKQGVVFINQQKTLEMERFLLLRQDLERLRNLCYMMVRREKMRKELHRSSIEIFHKQNHLLLDKNEDLSGNNIDFIRHRTTRFCRFSEYYKTEKEFEQERSFKLFNDSSQDGEESHVEIENSKDLNQIGCLSTVKQGYKVTVERTDSERNIFELLVPKSEDDSNYNAWSSTKTASFNFPVDRKINLGKSAVSVDQTVTSKEAEIPIGSPLGSKSSDISINQSVNSDKPYIAISQTEMSKNVDIPVNITVNLKKLGIPIDQAINSKKSCNSMTQTVNPTKNHLVNPHRTSKNIYIEKKNERKEKMILRNAASLINKSVNCRTSTAVEDNTYEKFNKYLEAHSRENGFMNFPDEKLCVPFYERNGVSETAPLANNCVNTSRCKRQRKGFRNFYNFEGQGRRNSPRLHRTDSGKSNGRIINPAKDLLGGRISKLIIKTKRRRLNSAGHYTSNRSDRTNSIKDEPPDYTRVTRSRSYSNVTGTA